ncbi:hypothetical protein L596_000138 [Steinernema carpocapsae]|uniref:Uncharacterized protein n=1 Tax=Steinernema carpocapsae TaxID=34508 RepID=A0A4V6YSS3_STECR|nr:hypothetical protein L596_000138 [Steinernema carpocapsae]
MNHVRVVERQATVQPSSYAIFDYRLIDETFDLIVNFDHYVMAINIFTRPAIASDRINRIALYWTTLKFAKMQLPGERFQMSVPKKVSPVFRVFVVLGWYFPPLAVVTHLPLSKCVFS